MLPGILSCHLSPIQIVYLVNSPQVRTYLPVTLIIPKSTAKQGTFI